ncbi:MAG TPA: sigma-70 family RNA polymerase sigma factor [Solirubrobacterales bacterium]|nr:sigma-70 family RNA polymerase sigma factor [Solirubrobacterales bacterium]
MDGTAPDRDEVRQASLRLPDRQRAALELRERKGLSYAQIAASLGISAGSVAQLIERARINLYDELRGTALASIAAPSAECERALPLIAAREDGELEPSSAEAAWLDAHLSACDRCRLAAEQMGEAVAFYRGEAPPSAPSAAAPARPTAIDASTASKGPVARSRGRHPSRRRAALAGSLVALALGGVAVALIGGNGSPDAAPPAADAAARRNAAEAISAARVVRVAHNARTVAKHATKGGVVTASVKTSQAGGNAAATPLYAPSPESDGGSQSAPVPRPHGSGGDTAVQPAKQKSTPKPTSKPKPPPSSTQTSQPTAQPASEPPPPPPPAEETTAPAEEPTAEHGHKGEPPGKPADRPPHE